MFATPAIPVEQTDDVLDADIESADWLTLDDIHRRPHRSHLVKRCLEDYLSDQQVPSNLSAGRVPLNVQPANPRE